MSSKISKKSNNPTSQRKQLRDELQFLGQAASTETALFHHRAAELNDVGITDVKAMTILLQEGQMTAGQLARRLSLTTGAITNLIDRLQKRGLVERQTDPNDRRKVVVIASLSEYEGGNIYQSIASTFDKLLKNYSTQELEFLVDFYKKSLELTKLEIAKLAQKKN